MSDAEDVRRAALDRATALADGDRDRLYELLHVDFRWTSHTGEQFDREAYVLSNTGDTNKWSRQELGEVEVIVDREAAVLRCLVVDTVDHGAGAEEYRMPMTQVWVRQGTGWVCLAGHAGPAL